MKKVTEMWLVVMIFALMCIAAGSVAVYLTPQEQRTLFIFIGISLIAAGATDVFTHIVFNRKVKIFKSGGPDEKETDESVEEIIEEARITEEAEETTEETAGEAAEETTEETIGEAAEETTDAAD